MSAYICFPEHFAALAAFANKTHGTHPGSGHKCLVHDWIDPQNDNIKTVRNVARKLAEENIRSVAARYPNDKDGSRPGPSGMTDEEICQSAEDIAEVYQWNPPKLSNVDLFSMLGSYEYQSCETDDWRDTLAYRQICWIRNELIRQLPGYDDATRDYYDETLHAEAA